MACVAFARAIEVFGARFWISCEHILNAKSRRASQRFVEALFEKVREPLNLLLREIRAGRVALRRVTLAQERSNFAAVPITQHDEGPDEVWPVLAASSLGAMTRNAFGNICRLAAIGCGRVDRLLVGRTGSRRRLRQQHYES